MGDPIPSGAPIAAYHQVSGDDLTDKVVWRDIDGKVQFARNWEWRITGLKTLGRAGVGTRISTDEMAGGDIIVVYQSDEQEASTRLKFEQIDGEDINEQTSAGWFMN